jgi:hypothetical protein
MDSQAAVALAESLVRSQSTRATLVERPGFLGGCDLWEGWGSWYPGSSIPLSCGNGQ